MTNLELKNNIDLNITNKTQSSSITPVNVGSEMKNVVDYVDQEIANIELLEGPTGPTGPAGINGTAGLTGSQGPQGVAGPVGPAGLEWQGLWDADTAYVENDAVSFNGASWFCVVPISTTGNDNPETDTVTWVLLASQGAQGPQGPQGEPGTVSITSETLEGGLFNSASVLTKDTTILNITGGSESFYSLPNMSTVVNPIGKQFLVYNPTFQGGIIGGEPGVTISIKTNESALINGVGSSTNFYNISNNTTVRFIYLGLTNVGGTDYQNWTAELFKVSRPKTNSSTITISSTGYVSINNDYNKFLPTSNTFNNITLPINPLNNKYVKGDSIIIKNLSDTFNLNVVNGINIDHYNDNGIPSTTPYAISPKGIVRATLGDGYYWIIELINYENTFSENTSNLKELQTEITEAEILNGTGFSKLLVPSIPGKLLVPTSIILYRKAGGTPYNITNPVRLFSSFSTGSSSLGGIAFDTVFQNSFQSTSIFSLSTNSSALAIENSLRLTSGSVASPSVITGGTGNLVLCLTYMEITV
jgi:hypothetical protein